MECFERTPHCVNNTQTCTKTHSALQEFPVHPKSQRKQRKCFFLMECSFLPFFCFLLQNSKLDYNNSQEWATLKILFNLFVSENQRSLTNVLELSWRRVAEETQPNWTGAANELHGVPGGTLHCTLAHCRTAWRAFARNWWYGSAPV